MFRTLLFCVVVFGLSLLVASAAQKQTDTSSAAAVNPDQGKMGVYRSLAQLAYQAYGEKHDAQAAALARILEKVWDRGETELRKSSPDTWGKIDSRMDAFIKPLTGFAKQGRADGAKLEAAYQQYLNSLAAAD